MREYLRRLWSLLLDLADAPARAAYDQGVLAGSNDMGTAWTAQEDALHTLANQWEHTAEITHDHAVSAALKTCADNLRGHIGDGSEGL